VTAVLLLLGLCGPGRGGAADLRSATACLDSSSPSYAADRRIVASLGHYGDPLTPFVFDGSSGVSDRFFTFLSHTKCGVIMGYPVDLTDADPPNGLAFTKPYLTTAYVLVTKRALTQATLKPGMTVAVGMATSPHFYLAGAFGKVPAFTADTYQTQEQVLEALLNGRADAAMVWKPSLVRFAAGHATARALHVSPLNIAHARWHIAALYLESDPAEERRFDDALARFARSGQLTAIVKPYQMENN
jgi:ABC-type amino acid transport substrate-binding protein